MAKVRRLRPDLDWESVSIVLTDDRGIARLHHEFLGQSSVTDVLTFRYTPVPGERPAFTGEIVVNVECAVRCANVGRPAEGTARRTGGADRELALYIAHGCDHLADETDVGPAGRRRMRRRELRWLREADAAGLIEGLIAPA